MSTRGNIVFMNNYEISEKNLHKELKKLKLYHVLRYSNSNIVYVHSDMYPSGALKDLQEFLQLDGAKSRANDTSYLSAWFVGWKCLDMSKWTRKANDRNFDVDKCKNPSLKNFKESKDFFGIGLLNELNDWCSYTYVILPKIEENQNSFDIYIYEGSSFEYPIAIINSEDDLKSFKNEDWWY